MAGLSSIFQSDEDNYVVAETLQGYVLASAEAAYENPGEQSPIVFVALGGEIKVSLKKYHCMDQKGSSFPSLTGTDNTN